MLCESTYTFLPGASKPQTGPRSAPSACKLHKYGVSKPAPTTLWTRGYDGTFLQGLSTKQSSSPASFSLPEETRKEHVHTFLGIPYGHQSCRCNCMLPSGCSKHIVSTNTYPALQAAWHVQDPGLNQV